MPAAEGVRPNRPQTISGHECISAKTISAAKYTAVSRSSYGEFDRERLCFTCNELLRRRSRTEIIYKDAALCVNCRMSRSALLLRLTGVGRIVLLSVKNKGNR